MEDKKLVLEQLKSKFTGQKLIIALINDVEKHDDLKDEVTIRSLCYLSYWLYILGDKENALRVAKIVALVRDWENDVIHSCKNDCLILCSYGYMKLNNIEQSDRFWAELVEMHFGEKASEVRKRVNTKKWKRDLLQGTAFESSDTQRELAEKNNNLRGVIYWMFRSLSEIFWIYRMGGSEKYPMEQLTQMIDEKISFLRENIENATLKDYV